MSANTTYEALKPLSPRETVAQRKEAHALRKSMKPLIEKRRRARINDSLNRLKSLILPLTGRNKTEFSRLEKSDILQMTVKFLGQIPPANPKSSRDCYREGFQACLQRVSALLPHLSLDQQARQRAHDFIQRSVSANMGPTCLNCCAQSSKTLPQIEQRLLSSKSNFSISLQNQSSSNSSSSSGCGKVDLSRSQPGPQAVSAAMWRPW